MYEIVLALTSLFSVVMIVCGLLFIFKPPKKVNYILGYRTTMSMKNQETWDYAHQYSGKVWLITGIITALVAFPLVIALKTLEIYEILMIILIVLESIAFLLMIPLTEIALRKRFDKNGILKK
ncbi:MAG TPA: SdpI family protein [Haloplasmataceae bacterium]